jgi:hypothetical protein
MFNFEKLETWHKAIAFGDLVYEPTRNFPVNERFSLTNQMQCAAVSICSNIAEGSARNSKLDYAAYWKASWVRGLKWFRNRSLARGRAFVPRPILGNCRPPPKNKAKC